VGIGSKIKNKAVFLDRDGVLNRAKIILNKPYPPSTMEEMEILSGVHESIQLLKHAGFKLIVITNQPDVARGTADIELVNTMNNYILNELGIDEIKCCFHDDSENCLCRKPKPGMVYEAEKRWNIDLSISYLIGDRWRDIETAKNCNLTSILIDYQYDEKKVNADFECTNFEEAVNFILKIY
jgi:D-glycero-D-manno-heptose 1,7-bisphosphate phosphatase